VSLPLRSGTPKPRPAFLRDGWADSNPHIVVLLPDEPCRELLLRRLSDARVTVVDQDQPLPQLPPVDVAVLHVSSLNLGSSPLLYDADLGLPELVFVVDEAWSPQHLALRSRGFRYIVSQSELAEWFPSAMPGLASLAQARRIVLSACDDGPPPPEVLATRQATGARLHAAETSFREIFLRSLLAEHGSRRRAAEEAGVPYRSFCEMLRKLGIG
jgi:hypothetical protein